MRDQSDLLRLVFDLLQYDFCEDHDEVQGNWAFDHSSNVFTIRYVPHPGAPYPPQTMRYLVTPIEVTPPVPPLQWSRDGSKTTVEKSE